MSETNVALDVFWSCRRSILQSDLLLGAVAAVADSPPYMHQSCRIEALTSICQLRHLEGIPHLTLEWALCLSPEAITVCQCCRGPMPSLRERLCNRQGTGRGRAGASPEQRSTAALHTRDTMCNITLPPPTHIVLSAAYPRRIVPPATPSVAYPLAFFVERFFFCLVASRVSVVSAACPHVHSFIRLPRGGQRPPPFLFDPHCFGSQARQSLCIINVTFIDRQLATTYRTRRGIKRITALPSNTTIDTHSCCLDAPIFGSRIVCRLEIRTTISHHPCATHSLVALDIV